MTGINSGTPITSDVQISNGSICPDFAALRVENHLKNPLNTDASFRSDIVIERYDVRYFRSDGRSTEGVDVPFRITGNVAQEIQASNSAVLNLEIVRRQAKLEPPLRNLQGLGGGQVVTMFAEVTIRIEPFPQGPAGVVVVPGGPGALPEPYLSTVIEALTEQGHGGGLLGCPLMSHIRVSVDNV